LSGLEPVRAHRLRRAHEQAAQTVAGARAESSRLRLAAETEAESLIRGAQQDGEASADADTGREWTAARRQAREIVLAAQKAAYDDLLAAATAAVMADTRYPRLVQRITDDARRRLGPGAEVSAGGAGVVASRRQRHVTWSVADAVKQAVDSGQVDIEELWR
jgi:membrane protein involved in colicin uptake